jgi:hypothetical protein
MATQQVIFQRLKLLGPALLVPAVLIFVDNQLEAAGAKLSHVACALTAELLSHLPSIALAGYQLFQGCPLDESRLFASYHSLALSVPLLCFIVGAA